MNKIIKRYVKQFGYKPTLAELKNLYTMGLMRLSDDEENTLIKEFKNNSNDLNEFDKGGSYENEDDWTNDSGYSDVFQ